MRATMTGFYEWLTSYDGAKDQTPGDDGGPIGRFAQHVCETPCCQHQPTLSSFDRHLQSIHPDQDFTTARDMAWRLFARMMQETTP